MARSRRLGGRGLKVLWVIDTLETGGAERSLLEIGRHLRVRPSVCHLYPGDALADEYRAGGMEVVSLDLPGRYALATAARRIAAEARRRGVDLLHSTLVRAGLAARGAAWLAHLPLVHSWVNEPVVSPRAESPPGLRRRLVHMADRATAWRVNRFLANTRDVAALHVAALGVAPERVEVVYRGRDPERLRPPDAAAVAALRRDLGAGDGDATPVLLNVGRLRPQKGQDVLIHAFAHLHVRRPGAVLWIAGDGPARLELEALAAELGIAAATRFLGRRDDVPALLAAADLFVFPSRREGHPGALLEAMFASLPIVASDLPAHRETVEDGASARLVPVEDATALAAAAAELLDDPPRAAALAAAALKSAEERFTVEAAARHHERVYRRVVEAHFGRRG